MSSTSEVALCNLLYRYAELMDLGQFEALAELFERARIRMGGREPREVEGRQLLEIWRDQVILYPCGTPRTRHVVTNPIIELDEAAGRARVRSAYTVYQATDELPLQVIALGRYHDEFERYDGSWHFVFRDYSMLDLAGELRYHLRSAVPP